MKKRHLRMARSAWRQVIRNDLRDVLGNRDHDAMVCDYCFAIVGWWRMFEGVRK